MQYRLLILFFIKLSFLGYSQNIQICQSDSLVDFSVVPSDSTHALEWEFIYGVGAIIVDGQFSESIKVLFSDTGDYLLQLREYGSASCYDAEELNITVMPNPLASFSSNEICIYDTVKFINTSIASDGLQTSLWRIGDQVVDAIDLNYRFDETGEYLIELSVISNFGCTDSESLLFKVSDKPTANFYHYPEKVTTLDPTVEFINLSSEGSVSWSYNNTIFSDEWQPIQYFEDAGWYEIQLTLEDENGCLDSITKSLLVENNLIYYLPSSFTPDGDGLNDVFGLRGYNIDKIQDFSLEITNRWGEIIFYSDGVNAVWDGKTPQGNEAMPGTYLWSIRLKDELGKQSRQIGEVTLLR